MNSAFILSAFTLGILGSFHCVGMCGPIALSLPVRHLKGAAKLTGILTYNFGRAVTYSALGAVFGLIGVSFRLFGWQQLLSISIGSILLIFFVAALLKKRLVKTVPIVNRWNGYLIQKLAPFFQARGVAALFVTGLLNGLLPCGLIYMAIAGAAATGSILQSSLFMAAFGLGTLPAMIAMSYAGSFISLRLRNAMRKSVPYVMAVMGILLILRGLNLNIPYISPAMLPSGVQSCH